MEGEVKIKSVGDTTHRIGRMELRTEKARVVARPQPGTVASGTRLADALAQMRAQGGDAVLVMNGDRLAGILTERDVLRRVFANDLGDASNADEARNADGARNADDARIADDGQPVDDFMTSNPETLHSEATLIEAMRSMEHGHYRNLPLVDDAGAVVGLLRQQDLLEYVAEAFPQEILNLPPRPHQLMEEQEGA